MNEILRLHVPAIHPRGVFGRYVDGEIEVTWQPYDIDEARLDRKGRARYDSYGVVQCVIGLARLQWKSRVARAECIAVQRSKNKNRASGESRWTEILRMVSSLEAGVLLPPPVLVHPDLHGLDGLSVIDGGRRILANVESSATPFVVAIVRRI